MKNKAYFSLLGLLLIAASGGGSVGKPSTDTVPAQYSFATGLDQAASLSPTNGEMAMSSSAGGFAQCGPFDPPESVEAPSELRAMIQASSTPAYRPAHADARDLPGIVKLEPETDVGDDEVVTGHCSATRIADNWFVTAAHCISEGYDRIVLKVGSEQLSSQKTQRVEADFAVCHARFKGERNDYSHDLALIHVDAAEMNKLAEARQASALDLLIEQLKNPLLVILMIGAVIGMVGSASGMSLGVGTCLAIDKIGVPLPQEYYISRLPIVLDPYEVLVVGLASFAICLLATVYPSREASRLRPVEGLRHG